MLTGVRSEGERESTSDSTTKQTVSFLRCTLFVCANELEEQLFLIHKQDGVERFEKMVWQVHYNTAYSGTRRM